MKICFKQLLIGYFHKNFNFLHDHHSTLLKPIIIKYCEGNNVKQNPKRVDQIELNKGKLKVDEISSDRNN